MALFGESSGCDGPELLAADFDQNDSTRGV